jgi:catechol 2,3-dioxygenase-like lactoylglutathione lyase family enzyme
MAFPALNHVAVTVRDMAVSGPWYRRLFGADPVVDEHTAPDERFSEFRVGLDHVGFGCADRAALETWMDRLNELRIQHGGIVDAPYGSGLSFRDPDGIALEFFAPPQ